MIALYLVRIEHPGSFVQTRGPKDAESENPVPIDGVQVLEGQRPDGMWRVMALIFDAKRYSLADVRRELGQHGVDYLTIMSIDEEDVPGFISGMG